MNPLDVGQVLEALARQFADLDLRPAPLLAREVSGEKQICLRVPADRLVEVMRFLYDDGRCRFDQLADLTCIDYLDYSGAVDRFAVTYCLVSTEIGHRLWVKCPANDPAPEVPSVTSIWKGADWPEREVWDLFGIRFADHPDLRRIMTWEGFESHPLRKDYPLRGRGEREQFERVSRETA